MDKADGLRRPSFSPEQLGIGRVFDVMTDALVVVDARGRILLWNPSANRIFGYEVDEALGMNVDRLVPPEFQERHHAGMDRYQRTGHGVIIDSGKPFEVPGLRKDGTRIWIDLTLSPMRHEGADLALGILRDVTDRVRLRERTALDRKQLQDGYQTLEAFTHVVSHDLKEPVRGVAAYLEELEADPDSPDRVEIIRRAAASNRHLSSLLDGLLEWGRTAMEPLELRETRIDSTLRQPGVSAQWDALARVRRAKIEIDEGISPVMATEPLVARVFGNLITNAIRHNPREHPIVHVYEAPSPLPGQVAIIVQDDGPGFPLVQLGSSQAVSNAPGSIKVGFGLAIARRAIERLRGSLHISNAPAGGGAVSVQLPAAHARASAFDERVREFV